MLKKHKMFITQALLLTFGIALIILGILSGETTAIMRKAAVVCLECIGIG